MKLADFENPGLFEPEPKFYCLIKPILNDRDWLQQLSQLREYNKPAIKVTMMLEAIPSHYQIWSEKLKKIPTLAIAFPDQIFINESRNVPNLYQFKIQQQNKIRGIDRMD